MKKIIVSNLVSLDGFFARPDGQLDFFVVEQEFFDYAKDLLNSVDSILYGRQTYEDMAAYWPTTTENDPAITHKMNHLIKIVFSKSLKTADWNNSLIVRNIDPQAITEWKQKPGKDMVIFGSGTIVSALTRLGLVDEYRIIVNPVLIGDGKLMFTGLGEKLSLKLIKTKTLSSGVVILYYVPVR
jgi:dihydrofolate reductase